MRAPRIPADAFNAQTHAFLALHEGRDTSHYIGNVGASVAGLHAGGLTVPVTIHHETRGDAWLCSPHTTYCDYAAEELARFASPPLHAALSPVIGVLGRGLRAARLDRCVTLNNWLVSTNSYPDAAPADIAALVQAATSRWPTHALWFRSLTQEHTAGWIAALRACGARLIPSRLVFLFDDIPALERRHADVRKDFRLLRRSPVVPLAATDLSLADYTRAADLYTQLYLDKYSRFNPRYTPALLRAWHHAGLLHLHGLRDADGRLQAVVGRLRFGNLVTSPIVGYDTTRPQRDGLYRLLAACVLQEALQDGDLVNLSAGVAHFKRQRGGMAAIEYSAVIADHLPARRRAGLALLRGVTNTVGLPLMRRLQAPHPEA